MTTTRHATRSQRATHEGPSLEAERADAAESIEEEDPLTSIERMRAVFVDVSWEEFAAETARILAEATRAWQRSYDHARFSAEAGRGGKDGGRPFGHPPVTVR